MTDKSRDYEDLIPSYIDGRLAGHEKRAFENQLETDPVLKAQVEEFKLLSQSYEDLPGSLPDPPDDMFDRIMEKVETPEKSKSHTSVWDMVLPMFHAFKQAFSVPRLAWTVAAVQMAVIVILVFSAPKHGTYQTLSQSTVGTETILKFNVVFNETASEKQIRQLLTGIGADIVSGPDQNGLYVILVKGTKDRTVAIEKFNSSGVVRFVKDAF